MAKAQTEKEVGAVDAGVEAGHGGEVVDPLLVAEVLGRLE